MLCSAASWQRQTPLPAHWKVIKSVLQPTEREVATQGAIPMPLSSQNGCLSKLLVSIVRVTSASNLYPSLLGPRVTSSIDEGAHLPVLPLTSLRITAGSAPGWHFGQATRGAEVLNSYSWNRLQQGRTVVVGIWHLHVHARPSGPVALGNLRGRPVVHVLVPILALLALAEPALAALGALGVVLQDWVI